MDHYRSINSDVTTLVTSAVQQSYTLNVLGINIAGDFWTTAGGAFGVDGGTVPSFEGNLILRGGTMGLTLTNTLTDTATLECWVYLIHTADNFVAPTGPVNRGWDPTIIPDFETKVGKVLMCKKVMLDNQASVTIEHKIKCRHVDQTIWTAGYRKPNWIVLLGNNESAVAANVTAIRYINLSFAGDGH